MAGAEDGTSTLLRELFGDYSDRRAVAWLERKFDSFDTSKAKELPVDETKNEKENFKSARILGYVKTLAAVRGSEANRPVLVASIAMKKDITERTSRQIQFNFAKKILQNAVRGDAAGLDGYPSQGIFFFHDKDLFFRLSLVSGEMDGRRFKFSEAKRQSFYINPDKPNNIAASRLNERIATFADLRNAFSVESLTKEFYGKLFDWYEWALAPATGVTFPNDDADDTDDCKYNNEAIIRLITRLMFTWFIRQRGIVNDELFTADGATKWIKGFRPLSMEDDNYYRCILQNLFFATFNCQPEKRGFIQRSYHGRSDGYFVKTKYRYEKEFTNAKAFANETLKKVPFLNCALFDCLDKQVREEDGGGLLLFDGFSDTPKRQAHVPNGLFFNPEKGIIPLFDLYEFTIDENNADDADVALDPELLGKVFENLLGAFNPETKETARNATGSFYTPREIVDYMVQESLKSYLKTKVPVLKDAWLENLFDAAKLAQGEALPFDGGVAAQVRSALYACKILDPACGSGAFPMGILHAMVRLFRRLDPKNTDLNDRIIKRYRDEKSLPPDPMESEEDRRERLEAIEQQLKDGQHYPDYARKLYLIENCIYGVDIQPIAAQISKLRFFISLLCDQLKDNWKADAENEGLLSLPNLEAKFVCANTLIPLPKTEGELALATSGIIALRQELQKNRHDIFRATTYRRKQALKENDQKIRDRIREAVRGTLAKPDQELIKVQRDLIAAYEKERAPYETPRLVRRKRPVQTSLFGEPTQDDLGYEDVDLNKSKRDEIDGKIELARRKIASEEAKSHPSNVTAIDKLANLVAGWDPYDQNASSSFFDPKWMFNVEDGFDIVIGNPPYVQLQANGGELARMYQDKGFETFDRMGDLYCLFYERGWQLLSANGLLSYITSDKWMRNDYGRLFRKFLIEKTDCQLLIDFAGQQLFNSATVEANILQFARNGQGACEPIACSLTTVDGDLSTMVKRESFSCIFDCCDSWAILGPIEVALKQKIETVGQRIERWNVLLARGILTGLNPAFVVDRGTRAALIGSDRASAEIIKPVLRGRDVQRYYFEQSMWVIDSHNGHRATGTKRVAIGNFPAVKRHLDAYKAELVRRGDQGDTPYNLRDCAYWDQLGKEKIVWGELSDKAKFVISRCYVLNTCFFMTGEKLHYLLGLLNSKLVSWYFALISTKSGMGTTRWLKYTIEQLPIVYPNAEQESSVAALVDRILAAKKADPEADTLALEAEIDQLVYKLYGLTEDEIAIVEGRDRVDATEAEETPPPRRRTRTSADTQSASRHDDDEELE